MNMIRSNFSFFKAGQGAFYGGRIKKNGFTPKEWTIVYDCGTSNFIAGNAKSLNREIDYFINNGNVIGILFISHLDYDHVSGIVRLIKECRVEKIVIPYFPENIRKYALLSIGVSVDDEILSIEDYIGFIENPYKYLHELKNEGVKEIFVIESEKLPENHEYGNYNSEEEDLHTVGNQINNKPDDLKGVNGSYNKNGLQFFVSNYWEFTTHVKSISVTQFINLKKCLNKMVNQPLGNEITYQQIKDIVINNRTKAHACYKKNLIDINAHGLILLHGPVGFKIIKINNYVQDELSHANYRTFAQKRKRYRNTPRSKVFCATLLMGDTSINNSIHFPQQFLNKLENVHIFQVPHHGASRNWNYPKYKNLKLGNSYNKGVLNVCNFGYGNRYGHPSHIVLDSLKKSIILNSQFLRFTTTYTIKY